MFVANDSEASRDRPEPPVDLAPVDPDVEIRRLPILLLRAREAFSAQFRPVFQGRDLTDPQWRVLRILANDPGIDTTRLAKRSNLLGPSLSRIVKDLAQRGLIERAADPADARRTFHTLSDSGREAIATVSPLFTPLYDDLKERLGDERIIDLARALESLLDVMGEPYEDKRPT